MLPAKLPLDAYRPFRRDVKAQRPAMEAIAAEKTMPHIREGSSPTGE